MPVIAPGPAARRVRREQHAWLLQRHAVLREWPGVWLRRRRTPGAARKLGRWVKPSRRPPALLEALLGTHLIPQVM